MKKQILLFALSIALTACGSKEIHLIKEHVKQDYFSDPTAKFDFEEIRKDSVHTVGDSINYYYSNFCKYTNFKIITDEKGYTREKLGLAQMSDSCIKEANGILSVYSKSVQNIQKEIDELETLMRDSKRAGMGSFMNSLGMLAGTDFNTELRKLKKKRASDMSTIKALEKLHIIFGNIKRLDSLKKSKELTQFWYGQYIVKINMGATEFQERFIHNFLIAEQEGQQKIVDVYEIN